ncbi:phenazine biosynthesis-like domain-containing protein 2 isoform X2 [Amblyomma americanum]
MEGSVRFPLYVVDAFTKTPFSGNPAAVMFLQDDGEIADHRKQSVAAEMKHSETAFVSKRNPQDEFDKGNQSRELQFHTKSGVLKASKGQDGAILLDLPARNSVVVEEEKYRSLLDAVLGDVPAGELRHSAQEKKLMVRLQDSCTRTELEALRPKPTEMLHAQNDGRVLGVAVTVDGGGSEYDFFSRYFAPWEGVSEDPVCGSAHTVLGPYWAAVLGKEELKAHQASARGGDLYLHVPAGGHRVQVGGHATVVVRGELLL